MLENITPIQFMSSFLFLLPVNIAILLNLPYVYEDYYREVFCFIILTLPIYFNFIYLLICIICDFSFCCSRKLMKLNDFMRNTFCHILSSISYLYTLLIAIDILRRHQTHDAPYFKLFTSLASSGTLIFDLLVARHKIQKYSSKLITIASINLILIEIICCVAYSIFNFKKFPLDFLENIDIFTYFGYCILFLILLIPCYSFNIFILMFRRKRFINEYLDNSFDEDEDDFWIY